MGNPNKTLIQNVAETGTLRGYNVSITVRDDAGSLTYSDRRLSDFIEACIYDVLQRFTLFDDSNSETAVEIAKESTGEIFNGLEFRLSQLLIPESEQLDRPGHEDEDGEED